MVLPGEHYPENGQSSTVFRRSAPPSLSGPSCFAASVGETSDIVCKEMYTFLDKGGRSMSLRPEGTAAVMRSFIENAIEQHKLFYIGPMFRYERAQQGRYRQHHQFGAEVIGVKGPEQDAEVIDLLYTLYQRLGLYDTACPIEFDRRHGEPPELSHRACRTF